MPVLPRGEPTGSGEEGLSLGVVYEVMGLLSGVIGGLGGVFVVGWDGLGYQATKVGFRHW